MDMDDRAKALLKALIERYIADGQPVGSRTLSTIFDFSPATIRNVMAELEAYAPLVTKGSYIVSTDGCMRDLTEVPRGQKDWDKDNPANAAEDFAKKNAAFVIEEPAWSFNESTLKGNVTHWPSAWLKRVS